MLTATYHDFFLGAVTLGGALTGLLFVAISVHPGGLGGTDPSLKLRIQATSALSALVNALFISLLALLPGGSIGGAVLAFGISGTLTMATMLLMVIGKPQGFTRWRLLRMIVLIVGQGSVFVIQIVNGVNLSSGGAGTRDIDTQATLIVVLFAFGVARAWEYVGGQRTGVWGTVHEARRTVLAYIEESGKEGAGANVVPSDRTDVPNDRTNEEGG